MYNRYTPQKDGSYQRRQVPDRTAPPPPPTPRPEEQPREQPSVPIPVEPACQPVQEHPCQRNTPAEGGRKGIFSNLLPKDLDSGDLIILLLLLLLLNDGSEEAPSALLTMALYFLL